VNPIKAEWTSPDGSVRLILGDALEVLPTLSGIEAVVTDPPYGIGWDREVVSMSGGVRKDGSQRTNSTWQAWKPTGYEPAAWDNEKPSRQIQEIAAAYPAVVWGGNFFADVLPVSGGWLVWSKGVTMPSLSKCELAWTNTIGHVEEKHLLWSGYKKGEQGKRLHSTQKPVGIMLWSLSFVAGTVADPFMGSGTTGVACIRTGRKFIGIEIEQKYWEIAVRRVRAELERFPLFDPPPLRQRELI